MVGEVDVEHGGGVSVSGAEATGTATTATCWWVFVSVSTSICDEPPLFSKWYSVLTIVGVSCGAIVHHWMLWTAPPRPEVRQRRKNVPGVCFMYF